ncbi:histidine phosphatase family protein [uncultured Victivallis sp.]|uniref:histidine phosphatase family protein n=1 Tax=uncultured Victivallis sp. TaxID=354118 RepID=UPI0025D5A4DB|nr:histidine phosphatase family protein [uncultured Victivallis sp.]
MQIRQILLIRHCEVPDEYRGRYIGSTDVPLSEAGRAAARNLAPQLASFAPETIVSSPLRRAVETAELAAPGREIRFDPRLTEIDFGAWEALTFAEIEQRATPEELRCWSESPGEMRFPGGESFPAFRRRVDAAFAELLAGTAGEIVAVVTHGGPAMRILATLHHLPAERQHELLPPRGSITVLNFHQGVFQP